MKTFKFRQHVYIFTVSNGALSILEALIVGVYQSAALDPYPHYFLDTAHGRYERLATEIYESVDEIKQHIEDFVVSY